MKSTSLGLTNIQFQAIQYSHLFHGLTEEQLRAALTHWQLKKYSDSTTVLLEGQTGDSVFLILEGRAKICCSDKLERDMVIGYKGAGEVLGEMGFIDGTARSATVETVLPSTLLWTDRTAFLQCCKSLPDIYDNLLKIIIMQLRLTNARVQIPLAPGASCRVARLLVQLAQKTKIPGQAVIPLKLSQADIGGMTDLSPTNVNPVLSNWKQRKYISIDTQYHIIIHDLATLERMAE